MVLEMGSIMDYGIRGLPFLGEIKPTSCVPVSSGE